MAFNFDMRFLNVPPKKITRESLIDFINDTSATKRLCFAMREQSMPLKEGYGKDVLKWFNLPFRDTIGPILEEMLGIHVCSRKDGIGCYYPCKKVEEVHALQQFVDKYRSVVFLRDKLDLSIALSMRELEVESGARTYLGQLEYLVKYEDDVDRTGEKEELVKAFKSILSDFPFFKYADYICAVPSSKNFMRDIAARLNRFPDISSAVCWADKQHAAKNTEDGMTKFEMLEHSGFAIDSAVDLKNKSVLLIDDLYRSGITMQYIAMKLKEAGASRVFGIAIIKGLRNK